VDDDSEKNLPEIITSYNFTKCGVDVVDELSASRMVHVIVAVGRCKFFHSAKYCRNQQPNHIQRK
jgi:hypothetical protein